jgi:hypothetical protein
MIGMIDGMVFHRRYLLGSYREQVRGEHARQDYSFGRGEFRREKFSSGEIGGMMDGWWFWKKPLCQSLDCNRILGERRE